MLIWHLKHGQWKQFENISVLNHLLVEVCGNTFSALRKRRILILTRPPPKGILPFLSEPCAILITCNNVSVLRIFSESWKRQIFYFHFIVLFIFHLMFNLHRNMFNPGCFHEILIGNQDWMMERAIMHMIVSLLA